MSYKNINAKLEYYVLAMSDVLQVYYSNFGTQAVVYLNDNSIVVLSSDQGRVTKIVLEDDVVKELQEKLNG